MNRGGSTSSASVPPSPKTINGGNNGISPTPSVASFSSYHTPVKSKKKSPRKSKKKAGNSTSDLHIEEDYRKAPPSGSTLQQDKLQAPKGGGTAGGRSYSPNVLKRFQAVKSGLSFVNHLKFEKPQ